MYDKTNELESGIAEELLDNEVFYVHIATDAVCSARVLLTSVFQRLPE